MTAETSAQRQDHAWAMAQQLERLIENGWGAIRHIDADANVIEFRAALLMATAKVIVRHAPPSADLERQAAAFSRILREQMRAARGREQRFADLERLMSDQESAGREGAKAP